MPKIIYCVSLLPTNRQDWRQRQREIVNDCGVELLPEGNPRIMWVRADEAGRVALSNHPLVLDVFVSGCNPGLGLQFPGSYTGKGKE
jgi:hypothetical protein